MKEFIGSNRVILILFLISLFIIFAYLFTMDMPEIFLFGDELFNLASQFSIAYVTSLIFYVIVNYIPEKRKKEKFRLIALKQMTRPLNRHIRLFQYMYKAMLSQKPEQQYMSIRQFFNQDFFHTIENFDFTIPSPLRSGGTWIHYINRECQIFYESLNDIINKYAYYLEDGELEIIEKIRNSNFMSIFIGRADLRQYFNGAWFELEYQIEEIEKSRNSITTVFQKDQQGRHHFKDYIDLLLSLVELHDKNNQEKKINIDEELWSETIAPRYRNT